MSAIVEETLKLFSEQLQCVICLKLPKNTHICPHCSILFCRGCILQWITRSVELDNDEDEEDVQNCPHCRKHLETRNIIKLRRFEKIEHLGPTLEKISGGTSDAHSEVYNSELDTVPKPKFLAGHFTLRNFVPQQGPFKMFSPKIVDDFGSTWRLEVWPRGYNTENHFISVYLELVKGLEGNYDLIIEMLNGFPMKASFTNVKFVPRDTKGTPDFVDTRQIAESGNPMDIQFRYFVRPTSFEEKTNLQQKLLQKLKLQEERFKGSAETFDYRLDNFSSFDKHAEESSHFNEFVDRLHNTWRLGLNTSGSGRFLEFKVHLADGIQGLYEIQLELVHDENECNKKMSFQHFFGKNSKAIFNMKIRWNQLDDFGFTHWDEDYLEVAVTICPIQVNLYVVQRKMFGDSATGSDTEAYDSSDAEYFF